MGSSFPYYRPGLRTTAYAAFTQLSLSEQEIREESQLNLCRDILEETLWILHPECRLALKFQSALDEVRRRSLAMLPKDDTRQQYSDLGPLPSPCSISGDSEYKHFDNISCASAQSRVASMSNIEMDVGKENSNAMVTSVFRAVPAGNRNATLNDDIHKPAYAGKKHWVDVNTGVFPVAKRLKVGGN
ncbi:hypothetical protein FOQG_18255 [Fusarium oxysporum f. sp. raphani 54005]|uniref:Uncharacterized protein n=1 Tax=Fusarium oxysporum f. sp. raphani 54005 TaxID=1089458 RepID=X0C2L3_FUSOX|nr:hypothetical protein FOQG_18255 [Fusarium oxysporum f. sp. raphani 54005]